MTTTTAGEVVLLRNSTRTSAAVALAPFAYLLISVVATFPSVGIEAFPSWSVAASAVGVALVGFVVLRGRQVTLTGQGTAVEGLFTRQEHRWSDILSVSMQGTSLTIVAKTGTWYLPLRPRGVEMLRAGGADRIERSNLNDSLDLIRTRWISGRGRDWTPGRSDPWIPPRTGGGSVVLRRSPAQFVGITDGYPFALWLLVMLHEPLFAVVLAMGPLAYLFWDRTVIDDEGVHIRSLWGHRTIPRTGVVAIAPRVGAFPLGAGARQLVLVDARGRTSRVAGLGTIELVRGASDPAFYRKWAWLTDELVGGAAGDIEPGSFA